MRRIIYASTSLVGNDSTELDAIIARSIALNGQAGITGLLWTDGTSFAQVLEGDHDEVGVAMDRIRADPRHTNIELVLDRAVLNRQLGGSAMRLADDGDESMAGTAFLLGFAMNERSASARRLREIIIRSGLSLP